jgi:hypothetical protein
MTESNQRSVSKTKTVIVFIFTIFIGYALFIFPDIFLGVTKINGGKIGINLLFIALFQFFSITALLYGSLRILKKDFSYIGLRFTNIKKDGLLGLLFGALWTALQVRSDYSQYGWSSIVRISLACWGCMMGVSSGYFPLLH